MMQRRLVEELRERGHLTTERVARAFLTVPRHVFVPHVSTAEAYSDRVIPLKIEDGDVVSSSSQPAIMAEMLEQLDVRPGQHVLEIGAGSGYNAALLSELTGPYGSVTTIDIDAEILHAAREHLDDAGYGRVRTLHGDGAAGDPHSAPFDAIIATVAIADIPRAWFDQLRPGGRVIAPLNVRLAAIIPTFVRHEMALLSRSIIGGSFMPFRGSSPSSTAAGTLFFLDAERRVRLRVADALKIAPKALALALTQRSTDVPLDVRIGVGEDDHLAFWLNLRESHFCRLAAYGSISAKMPSIEPRDATSGGCAYTVGICSETSLTLLDRTAADVWIRHYGKPFEGLDAMIEAVRAWDNAGRPRYTTMAIAAVPHGLDWSAPASPRTLMVTQPSTTLYLLWP